MAQKKNRNSYIDKVLQGRQLPKSARLFTGDDAKSKKATKSS